MKNPNASIRNRMKGKVDVYWNKEFKLHSELRIPGQSSLKGDLGIPYRNRMRGNIDVWWRKDKNVDGSVQIPSRDYLESSIGVPYRNRMKGHYNILAPKRITKAIDPIDDTYVTDRSPYAIFGQASDIRVGYEGKDRYEGLLKFNMQEHFPMYGQDGYIFIESLLKLTITNVRDIKDGDLDIYEVAFGDWKEESTTWANKPIKSNVLSSSYRIEVDPSDRGNVNIYINIEDLAKKWLENPRKNNGLIIQAREEINNIVSFYSKENGNPELNPKLIVTYIDLNSPFLTKDNHLSASLSVWKKRQSCILSQLEVTRRQSTDCTPSNLIALNKPGDLLASLEIVKDRITGELDLVGSNMPASVDVFSQETGVVLNELNIKQIAPSSELRISHLYDLEANLRVSHGSHLSGFLGINANRIVNEAKVSHISDLSGKLHTLATNQTKGVIQTAYGTMVDGMVVVDGGWNIEGELEVVAAGVIESSLKTSFGSYLTSEIRTRSVSMISSSVFYGRFSDTQAKLRIIPYSIVCGSLRTSQKSSLENLLTILAQNQIENSLKVSSFNGLKNIISVRYSSNINALTRVVNENISSNVNVIHVESLNTTIAVQGRTLINALKVSRGSMVKSDVTIPERATIESDLCALNEKIDSLLNVYVNRTSSTQSILYNYAVNPILSSVRYQHGSLIENHLMVYVDKISVTWAYIEVINEDWEYEQKRGYGYIM